MAAVAIPGPQATEDAAMTPGRWNIGENDLRSFFLSQIPALQQDPAHQKILLEVSQNFGREKSDWTLPDMQNGLANIMISNVQVLINAAMEEQWYFRICPRRPTTAMKFRVNTVYFRPNMAQEAAPRTVPDELEIEQSAAQYGLTRKITGFSLDTETLLSGVQKGSRWFQERMAMLAIGLIETDKFTIISGLFNMHRAQRGRWHEVIDMVRQSMTTHEWVMRENNLAFMLCKEKDPLTALRDMSLTDFEFHGVPTNNLVTILHWKSARALVRNEYYRNTSQGNRLNIIDNNNAVADMLGSNVNFTRNFKAPKGKAINPIGQIGTFGLYFLVADPHEKCRNRVYRTEHRNIKIPNCRNVGMMELSFGTIVENSGRWSRETGELLSLLDPGAWATANADLRGRITNQATRDALHVHIKSPLFEPKESYTGPATHFGSIKTSVIPTSRFQSCAQTIMAEMGEAVVTAIESGIKEYLSLVATAGRQSLDTNAFKDLVNVQPTVRSEAASGCKPSNPALRFAATDPSTGFMLGAETGIADGAGVDQIPAGFTSLAAFRYLASAGRASTDLTARLKRVITAADLFAGAIDRKFPGSPLADPDYAATDMQDATVADMLFTGAILPRRPPVIILRAGGGGTAAFDSVKAIYDNAEKALAGSGKDALLKQFEPTNADSANVLKKKAIGITALRSFAQGADKQFVTDPAPILGPLVATTAAQTVDAFKEAVIEAMRKGGSATSYRYTRTQMRQNFDDVVTGLQANDGGNIPVMTKLLLEPQQVVQLAGFKRANNADFARITIGRDGRQDMPATDAELQEYATKINAGTRLGFSGPLSLTAPLVESSVGPAASIGQLRAYMIEQNYPLQRAGLNTRPSGPRAPTSAVGQSSAVSKVIDSIRRNRTQDASVFGAAAGAVDPSGAAKRIFGCLDHNIDLMFTDAFAQHWAEANAIQTSFVELLLMRLYMTSSTNFNKSIRPWLSNNVRIPLAFGVFDALRVRTNPVIRVVPGEGTCFLASGFQRTLRGTDQHSGMFGVNHSYYSGFIPVENKNVQIYNNFDPAGWVSGLSPQWAQFGSNPRGLVSVLLPNENQPVAMSPFGAVGFEGKEGAGIAPLETATEQIAQFEQYRWGQVRQPWQPMLHPENPYGVPVELVTQAHYSRAPVLIAGMDCDYTQYVSSASAIPTSWCVPDLRDILDGNKLVPNSPFVGQAGKALAETI